MLAEKFGAEAGPPPETAAPRRSDERWMAEHFGRDLIAWIARPG